MESANRVPIGFSGYDAFDSPWVVAEILPRTSYASHPCGYHLWVSVTVV